MAKAWRIGRSADQRGTPEILEQILIFCPGCKFGHAFTTKVTPGSQKSCWTWNGSLDSPTFAPSMLVRYPWGEGPNGQAKEMRTCHSYVRDGKIEFLGDCSHDLKGQTVDLEDALSD